MNRDQPSAAASPGRRSCDILPNEFDERVDQHGKPHKARGCKGSGSSQKWAGGWPWRKRARKDKDEWQRDVADYEQNEHAREDSDAVRDTDGRDSQDYDIEVAFHPREDGGIDAVRVSDHVVRRKCR
jgi:hypothetical protein